MIYFIYGDDIVKRRLAKEALAKSFTTAVIHKITNDNINVIDEGIDAQDIFGDTIIYELHGMLENKDSREYLYDRLESMMNSQNIFIIDDTNILKPTITKVSKFATKSFNCILESGEEGRTFMPKALCDAVLRKDRRGAFVELHKLLQTGESGEAIAAILWWRVKTMLEALANGKQYITEFAGKDSGGRAAWDKKVINYKPEELQRIGYGLIAAPGLAHSDSSVDINSEIEKIILSI